jgi:guanylate kinase
MGKEKVQKVKEMIIVMAGASGVGKDATLKRLVEKTNCKQVVTNCAGRELRKGEVNGVDYNFVSVQRFEEMIQNGELLEYARYGETYKGTSLGCLEKVKDSPLIWRIDPEAAANSREILTRKGMKNIAEKITTVYIGVPSVRNLYERQMRRDPPPKKEIVIERMRQDWDDWKRYGKDKYDLLVINEEGKLDQTVDKIIKGLKKVSRKRLFNKIVNWPKQFFNQLTTGAGVVTK